MTRRAKQEQGKPEPLSRSAGAKVESWEGKALERGVHFILSEGVKLAEPGTNNVPPPPARVGSPPTPEEQVDHIIRMMVGDEWRGMRSRRELAELWGVHERTVGDRAVAAMAVVNRRGAPMEEEIDAAIVDLERVKEMAIREGNPTGAVNAIRLRMELRGALSRHRPKGDSEKPGGDGVDAMLKAVLDDPTMREKVQAILAGKAKEMH